MNLLLLILAIFLISEEEIQVDISETSLPLEGTATVEGISSILFVLFFI